MGSGLFFGSRERFSYERLPHRQGLYNENYRQNYSGGEKYILDTNLITIGIFSLLPKCGIYCKHHNFWSKAILFCKFQKISVLKHPFVLSLSTISPSLWSVQCTNGPMLKRCFPQKSRLHLVFYTSQIEGENNIGVHTKNESICFFFTISFVIRHHVNSKCVILVKVFG